MLPSLRVYSLPPGQLRRERRGWGQTKTTSTGLEGFVDWTGVVDCELAEEEEMFSLALEFST